uniref:Replication initiator protein n=1 Tax=Fringilla montifringilla CRESS-DNA-virus sp. TaxID=2815044 RepID=A0A8A4XCU0_9VIRU|nr:MAG: replication initiator protein [Fringilla montifringilla CRESS-DNA-virus sp.]
MEQENFHEAIEDKKKKHCLIVFTSYETKEKTEEVLKKIADWYLFGKETCPTTGRVHMQGMAWKKKGSNWPTLLKAKFWIAKCRDPECALAYCEKDGEVTEHGMRPNLGALGRPKMAIKDYENMSFEELKELPPHLFNTVIKGLDWIKNNSPKVETPCPYVMHDWQKEVMEIIPKLNDREILYLYDNIGGQGKTKFFGWLGSNPNFEYVGLGKRDDILYGLDQQAQTIIFDFARLEGEFIPWGTIEKVKDGNWKTGKYQGKKCMSGNKNVIVCSNDMPKTHLENGKEVFSRNRWTAVYEIKNLKLVKIDMSVYF